MKRTDIINALNRLDIFDLIDAHNAALRETNDVDHCIYEMWELNAFFYGDPAEEILSRAYDGKFCLNDAWFTLNEYGNLVSFGNVTELKKYIRYDVIADTYMATPAAFENTAYGLAAALNN